MRGVPDDFSVEIRQTEDGCVTLIPRGELDISSVLTLRDAIQEARRGELRRLVIDLGRFCRSSTRWVYASS